MKKESVFEKYAHEYGLLTNEKARKINHLKEVRALIDRFQPTSVLDAGCAIGLTSALFAGEDVTAVGLDRSRRMITEAKKIYGKTRLPVSFRVGNFEKLPKVLDAEFDMVVCLANSISGVGSETALVQSLSNFKRALKPGGTLVLQALNYMSMNEGDVFPIKATQQGKVGYLRFARRRGSKLEIVVVRLDFSTKPFGFEPFTHEFDSFTPTMLREAVTKSGFGQIRRYGNLLMTAPFSRKSRDLIITASNPRV